MQDLIGFFQQPLEPGYLCLQRSDNLHTAVFIHCGRVHYVFSSTGVAQSAQGLIVVHISRRNGCYYRSPGRNMHILMTRGGRRIAKTKRKGLCGSQKM